MKLLACLILSACAFGVRAEINVGSSLAWLTVESPEIAIVSIVGRKADQDEGNWRAYEFKQVQALKGKPPLTGVLKVFLGEAELKHKHGEGDLSPPGEKDEFLVFWDKDGKISESIDLAFPPKQGAAGRGVAFDLDFKVIGTRQAILTVADEFAKAELCEALPLHVPADAEAYKALWSGSACFLKIPVSALKWHWPEGAADGKFYAKQLPANFSAEIPKEWDGAFKFKEQENVLLEMKAYPGTSFVLGDKVLIYAAYHPMSSGCSLVAYDLEKKAERWKTHLQGLGPIAHSKYHNAVHLEMLGALASTGYICVFGQESAGRYIEVVDLKTGKSIYNRKLADSEK